MDPGAKDMRAAASPPIQYEAELQWLRPTQYAIIIGMKADLIPDTEWNTMTLHTVATTVLVTVNVLILMKIVCATSLLARWYCSLLFLSRIVFVTTNATQLKNYFLHFVFVGFKFLQHGVCVLDCILDASKFIIYSNQNAAKHLFSKNKFLYILGKGRN